ncbi:MAG: hypothetical protein WAO41_09090 [Candidatus Nanopelagicales bacterium]
MRTLTRLALQGLGQRVAESGITLNRADLGALASAAGSAGISPVLIDVMLDDTQPEVARLRAFERVSCALSRWTYQPTRADVAIAA